MLPYPECLTVELRSHLDHGLTAIIGWFKQNACIRIGFPGLIAHTATTPGQFIPSPISLVTTWVAVSTVVTACSAEAQSETGKHKAISSVEFKSIFMGCLVLSFEFFTFIPQHYVVIFDFEDS